MLNSWRNGDRSAEQHLMELVYSQLQAIAVRSMRGERPSHTLCPTELVHEAWLRLDGAQISFENRAHFLSLAAVVMRRILVDYARARSSGKRFGGMERVPIEDVGLTVIVEKKAEPEQLIDLDRALSLLAVQDPRKGRLMELVYFGGLDPAEAATVLSVNVRTVQREIQFCKVWIGTKMQADRPSQHQA